jgi:hypothetical protein
MMSRNEAPAFAFILGLLGRRLAAGFARTGAIEVP